MTQNVDPISGLAQVVAPAREHEPKRDEPRRKRQSQASAVTTATATPTAPTASRDTDAGRDAHQRTADGDRAGDSRADAGTDAATGAGRGVRAGGPGHGGDHRPRHPSPPARASTPAPAPAGGPGEFETDERTRDWRHTMRSRPTTRRCALASRTRHGAGGDVRPMAAVAGEFSVANCQADPLNYSTRAFEDFATRGMKIKRACDPEGPGLRGLITSNVVRRGRVPRGAVALAAISAPAGTRFTSFRWAGSARRRDCRYALQLFAIGPDIPPISMKNVRANQACPRPRGAQAAGFRSRTFNVMGATRIVQRVICMGGAGRKSCSAHGLQLPTHLRGRGPHRRRRRARRQRAR